MDVTYVRGELVPGFWVLGSGFWVLEFSSRFWFQIFLFFEFWFLKLSLKYFVWVEEGRDSSTPHSTQHTAHSTHHSTQHSARNSHMEEQSSTAHTQTGKKGHHTQHTPTISTFNDQWPLSLPMTLTLSHCHCPSVLSPLWKSLGILGRQPSNSPNNTAQSTVATYPSTYHPYTTSILAPRNKAAITAEVIEFWHRSYCKLLNPSTTSFVQRWSNDIRCWRQQVTSLQYLPVWFGTEITTSSIHCCVVLTRSHSRSFYLQCYT